MKLENNMAKRRYYTSGIRIIAVEKLAKWAIFVATEWEPIKPII